MKPRRWIALLPLLPLLAALAGPAPAIAGEAEAESTGAAETSIEPLRGRWLQAAARHRQGDLGPLPPNSPGGAGVYVVDGARVTAASAYHPFSVGHYGPWGCGLPYPVWLGNEHRGVRPDGVR